MSSIVVHVYGKPQCPYCDMAKQYLTNNDIPFVYKELEKDFTRDQVLSLFPGARTFPQCRLLKDFEFTYIGGYEDLIKANLQQYIESKYEADNNG